MNSKGHSLNLVLKKRRSPDAFPLSQPAQSDTPERVTASSEAHSLYRQTADTVREDCFAIDPHWLIHYQPKLWRRLVWLDYHASELERRGETEEDYQRMLGQIVQTVKEARELYEQAANKEEMAQ